MGGLLEIVRGRTFDDFLFVPFKVLRGMASIEAVKDRLDVEEADAVDLQALGIEVSVPERGSVRPIIREMIKHVCSAISYGGATSLAELKRRFTADPAQYVVALSEASRRESYER
jgi:IMP dehydrogenase/GMP reductase